MNVALFASSYHPHVGGVEELCRQLCHAYRALGHRTIVVTNRWPRDLPEHEVIESTPVYRLPMRIPDGNLKAKLNAHLTGGFIRREMLAILRSNEIDVLHVQCVSSNARYALFAKERLGLPLVVTAQGELTMDASGLYQRSHYMREALRSVLDGADFITACSRNTLDELEDFWGSRFGARANVVYNGVSPTEFTGAQPYSHPAPYILGIGRLVPQKGFDILIRAFREAKLPLHRLLIAGDGPERIPLEQLASKLNLASRILFVGRADRPTTARLFRGCSFFVLPSRHEPLGIVTLEAMAARKAVVATRVGGVPEIVTDGRHGLLIPPESVEHMTDALRTMASDAELRERFAAAAQSRAHNFAWPVIAQQYLMIYSAVRTGAAKQLRQSGALCDG